MSVIEIKDLCFSYSKKSPFEKNALKNVSFEINEGEFVCIIGETGSGKSTLVQHLNGLIRCKDKTSKINILGKDAKEKKNLKNLRFDVGMVFQYPEYQLFEETVEKDVAFGPKNMRLDDAEIENRVKNAIKVVGLDESFLERSPFELSGGEKRRVAIAGVISMQPKILVLDEPFAGLDPEGVQDIISLILKLKQEVSPTIILVSHNMDAVAELADRVLVLHDGELVGNGTPQEIFADRKLISAAGLELPFVCEFADELTAHGIEISRNITTKKDLVNALKNLKAEGEKNV